MVLTNDKAIEQSQRSDLRLWNRLNEMINRVETEQLENLLNAAEWMVDTIEEDRLIYIYGGGGHTCLVMQELFWRAGGLANICPMIDFAIHPVTPAYMYLYHERMHGIGDQTVKYYGVEKGDLAIVFHSYGFNAPTIDCAMELKRRQARIVAVSSSDWHRSVPLEFPIRHNSGKTLFDIADICIDDYVPYGDAVIPVDGFAQPITSVSGMIDFYIAHRLEMECVKACVQRGIEAPVWSSANIPGGDQRNEALRAKYNGRIKWL